MSSGFAAVNRSVDKMTGGLKNAAKKTAVAAGIIGGTLGILSGPGLAFEQAITNVGAVSLQTRDQIAPLEELAKSLGATTKFTATQAANAMEILAKAGFNVNAILEATPAVLSAAAASGLEIADVADHVSNVLKGMGLETSNAARVSDVLALASARTNSTIGSLGESMRNVAATARTLRIPLEDAVASVALLQDVGLDASVAGSALNTMLTKMAAPTASITRQMRRFGISFKDANGDMLPFAQVLDQLTQASDKAGGNFDKIAFLAELVGLRGQKAADNLADLFKKGRVQALSAELQNAAGIADRMANIRMGTTLGSFTLLRSAIDAVQVQIFDMNSGPLKDAIDSMTAWVNANQELLATNVSKFLTKVVDNFGLIGKSIGVFFTLISVLKVLTLVLTAVNLVMAANPIGLIVLAIGVLIAAIVAAIIWWDEIKAAFLSLPGPVKAAIAVLSGPIGRLIAAAALVMKNWKPIKAFFADLWSGVVRIFDAAIAKIMRVVDRVKNAASAIVDTTSNIGSGVAEFFGFGDEAKEQNQISRSGPQVVSPQGRLARSIQEQRTTSTAEVTIRDESGRAEVTGGTLGGGLSLQPSGAF
jgi:TP901 family phage tail tape measure protein